MHALAIVLIAAVYVSLAAVVWPLHTSLTVACVAASFVVSFVTYVWVESVFAADNFAHGSTWRLQLGDKRYSIGAALLMPSPFLFAVLAFIWLLQRQVSAAVVALLLAGALAVVCIRVGLFGLRSSRHKST